MARLQVLFRIVMLLELCLNLLYRPYMKVNLLQSRRHFHSENVTSWAWFEALADNLGVVFLVVDKVLATMFLCLYLYVVLLHDVVAESWLRGVLHENTSAWFFDRVANEESDRLPCCQHSTPWVCINLVVDDLAIRVDKHNSICVLFNAVIFDNQAWLSFGTENPFWLWILDIVVFDSSVAGIFATKSDVGLNIVINLIRDNLGMWALDN